MSDQQEELRNPLVNQAQDYLRKHHIIELFEDLCTGLAYKKPDNIDDYLVEQLENRKSHGLNLPIFTETELENIFNLYDLKQEGRISRFKCREALKSIASTQFQLHKAKEFEDIPERVDMADFKSLCETVLGCK